MENKQVNNQEKPFEDKRETPNNNGTVFSPKYVSIDEWAAKQMGESLASEVQKSIYPSIANGFNYKIDFGQNTKVEPKDETPEEWIWVDGYKGTDADMKCMCEYQYVMGKQFDMPEGSTIEDCKSGFHLCLKLDDVFHYKTIGYGNRFFRVHALVRKKDFEEYGKATFIHVPMRRNKIVAKSIVFVRELTNDEILKGTEAENWSEEDKKTVRERGIGFVRDARNTTTLIGLGYSEAFAKYVVDEGHFKAAYAAGTQKDLSMDMKVAYIMRNEY